MDKKNGETKEEVEEEKVPVKKWPCPGVEVGEE